MKTLVLVAHPEYDNSLTEAFLQQSQSDIETVDWVVLSQLSHNEGFDTKNEQARLAQYDRIILQFPMYWYSAPAILKQYQDDVFTRNFVYADRNGWLRGKELGIVTTLGDPIKDYQAGGREGFSISELFKPYQAVALKAGMRFLKPFVVAQFAYMTDRDKAQLLLKYRNYLANDNFDHFKGQQEWHLKQLTQLKAQLPEAKQMQMAIIIQYLEDNYQKLDELNWELSLIKKEEDE